MWTIYSPLHLVLGLRVISFKSCCGVNANARPVGSLQEAHSKLVAAVLRHRLTIHGQALLCCAVRDQVSTTNVHLLAIVICTSCSLISAAGYI